MKDCQKVYIKGNPNRGAEVIKALTDLGAINLNNLDGKKGYYYISPLGFIIGVASYEENMMSILKEFYKEIFLERWKPEYEGLYYFIDIKGGILDKKWFDTQVDNQCYKFGNCFRTQKEAEIARDKFKEILNNDKLTLVYYPPKPNPNGHDYVDLGLPSGTLWATMNVGASKPSDAGLYFQWGDVKGYTKEEVGKGSQFNWSDYKWYDTDGKTFTKYTTKGAALDLEDDAAHVNMGGDWHMPTREQLKELIDNTTSTWTSQDGVNGRLFTSKKDTSKSIFIPAAGCAWDGSVYGRGNYGYVWSSVLSSSYVFNGQGLYFVSDGAGLDFNGRYDGFSVRGVLG